MIDIGKQVNEFILTLALIGVGAGLLLAFIIYGLVKWVF